MNATRRAIGLGLGAGTVFHHSELRTPLLLSALQQLTHTNFPSPRPWIYDGLAHYAQLSFLQERGGRPAVLDYLQSHRDALLASEKQTTTEGGNRSAEPSIRTWRPCGDQWKRRAARWFAASSRPFRLA